MTDRDINIRSVLFLVIGILLIFSLIICVYIVNGEKDLVKTEADVIDVKKDSEGTGKNDVTVVYNVDGTSYEYNFYYKDDISVDDKLPIYYHEENVTSVQTFKTSKIIFISPIIGLVLCSLGIYEMFKNNKLFVKNKKEINISNTDNLDNVSNILQAQINSLKMEEVSSIEVPSDSEVNNFDNKESSSDTDNVIDQDELPMIKSDNNEDEIKTSSINDSMPKIENDTEDVVSKVKHDASGKTTEELKEVIKEVLKEVIKEVNIEKEEPKKVEQQKIIPNYFYISGTSLVYEELGKKAKEINLKDIKRVVRTINSAGNVVKLVVSSDEVKCVLTNMKNIDLEQVANLLHNKMRTIDDTFKEIIERKEY